jgi:hypothetical protein
MQNITAETAKTTIQNIGTRTLSGEIAGQAAALERGYHQIGISAVAAAVRYQGSAKNPAYAPAAIKSLDRSDEPA